jgi:hypothetical protein
MGDIVRLTGEAETGGERVGGQLELHSETLFQKQTKTGMGGRGWRRGAGGRNDPNNVHTCEYMNNKKQTKTKQLMPAVHFL